MIQDWKTRSITWLTTGQIHLPVLTTLLTMPSPLNEEPFTESDCDTVEMVARVKLSLPVKRSTKLFLQVTGQAMRTEQFLAMVSMIMMLPLCAYKVVYVS